MREAYSHLFQSSLARLYEKRSEIPHPGDANAATYAKSQRACAANFSSRSTSISESTAHGRNRLRFANEVLVLLLKPTRGVLPAGPAGVARRDAYFTTR